MSNFDTQNPESLLYDNGMLRFTVLGGIKLEGLDRMRATLKAELPESPQPPIRHNLDLYNDTQLEKFIRKAAERLEIGTSVIATSLAELTAELENYRLERIEEAKPQAPQKHILTEEERQEAETFLQSPNLLERTNELIGKSGVTGEEINRLLMYIIFTSRKRNQPLHVVSLGASGTGKTHLQEKVGELIPEEDKIEITTLSENAFYYFGQQELKHKLILIEDLDGAESVLYPLRELQSKKKISKTIARKNTKGETQTIHLVVEGPVSVSGCTTQEQIYEDNANRSFLLYLDDSPEQDQRIMDYQRRASAGRINYEQEEQCRTLLKNVQRILEPIKVVNPFAEYLQLPKETFKPRRTNTHYLQFIEAVTFYKQHQKQLKADSNGEAYIETELQDIAEANRLLEHTLIRKSDVLSGACRNHFEKLKLYLIGLNQSQFTNREISQKLRISLATVKRHHLQLYNCGYLNYERDNTTKAHYYEIISYKEYEQLQGNIHSVLDEALNQLETLFLDKPQPNSLPLAHAPNEPIKEHTTSELEQNQGRTEKRGCREEKNKEAEINNPHLENYYNWLKNHLAQQNQTQFTNREITETGYRSSTIIKKNHRNLLESGHITIQSGSKETGYVYRLNA